MGDSEGREDRSRVTSEVQSVHFILKNKTTSLLIAKVDWVLFNVYYAMVVIEHQKAVGIGPAPEIVRI